MTTMRCGAFSGEASSSTGTTSRSGTAAHRSLETLREEAFDLVIMDNRMPGLSGLEILPSVRREFPEVPVLLVTAFGGRQVALSALRLGAASYLEKPFRLGQLRDAIAGLITGRQDSPRAS